MFKKAPTHPPPPQQPLNLGTRTVLIFEEVKTKVQLYSVRILSQREKIQSNAINPLSPSIHIQFSKLISIHFL